MHPLPVVHNTHHALIITLTITVIASTLYIIRQHIILYSASLFHAQYSQFLAEIFQLFWNYSLCFEVPIILEIIQTYTYCMSLFPVKMF